MERMPYSNLAAAYFGAVPVWYVICDIGILLRFLRCAMAIVVAPLGASTYQTLPNIKL
jgi:hypothetical protein